jgi:hypothetical protein
MRNESLCPSPIIDRFRNEIHVNDFIIVSYNHIGGLFCYKGLVLGTRYPVKGFILWPSRTAYDDILVIQKAWIENEKYRIIKCTNPEDILMHFEDYIEKIEEVRGLSFYKNGTT